MSTILIVKKSLEKNTYGPGFPLQKLKTLKIYIYLKISILTIPLLTIFAEISCYHKPHA